MIQEIFFTIGIVSTGILVMITVESYIRWHYKVNERLEYLEELYMLLRDTKNKGIKKP